MTEQDQRTTIYIKKRKIDSTTHIIIEETEVSLQSMTESIDDLIGKAQSVFNTK